MAMQLGRNVGKFSTLKTLSAGFRVSFAREGTARAPLGARHFCAGKVPNFKERLLNRLENILGLIPKPLVVFGGIVYGYYAHKKSSDDGKGGGTDGV